MNKTAYFILITIVLFYLTSCKKQLNNLSSDIEWSRTYGGSGLDYPYSAAEGKNGTFMIVGYTTSNDGDVTKNYCAPLRTLGKICGLEDAWILNISGEGNIITQHSYNFGGAPSFFPSGYYNSDRATSVIQSIDGGWVVAGQTNSYLFSNYKSCAFILKISSSGDSSWSKVIQRTSDKNDSIACIISNRNEGFVLAGATGYDRDDPNGNHDTTTDGYVFSTDAMGYEKWNNKQLPGDSKAGGGWKDDKFNAITQTKDGGYVAVGQTKGFVYNGSSSDASDPLYNRNFSGYTNDHGNGFGVTWDVYVAKINADGSQDLKNNFELGGEANDIANAIIATADSGFIFAGQTNSIGQDVSGNHSNKYDVWVVKLDKALSIQWQKTYGGAFGDEIAKSMVQTPDGGFVIVGQTTSNDGDVKGNHGNSDAWVFKIDKNGNMLWQKALGGSGADGATNVITTSDGGLLITGYSFSNDGDVPSTNGYGGNFWVVKLRRQ